MHEKMRKGWIVDLLWKLFVALFLLVLPIESQGNNEETRKIEEQLKALQEQQAQMLKQVQALQDQLAKMKEEQMKKEKAAKEAPQAVTAGFGKIKFNGLSQNWVVGGFGNGTNNTARLRRMELKFVGEIRPDVQWTVMFDPAKSLSVNTTTVGGTTVATGINQASNILQDAFISYAPNSHLSINVGQEKVPLSMEGLRSSAQLLTVERAIFNTLPVNNGRVGDIRDVGIQVKASYPQVDFALALLNDSGPRQNTTDNNRKDLLYRAVYKGLRYTRIGVNGTVATESFGASKVPRQRFGGDLTVHYGPHIFEFEYAYAKDAPAGATIRAEGGYALYAYQINSRLQLVARGEIWNPNLGVSNVSERDYTLGLNWYLRGHNAKIQLNWVRKDIDSGAPSFLGPARTLLLTNFQTAW
jgi:hypothetical protein